MFGDIGRQPIGMAKLCLQLGLFYLGLPALRGVSHEAPESGRLPLGIRYQCNR